MKTRHTERSPSTRAFDLLRFPLFRNRAEFREMGKKGRKAQLDRMTEKQKSALGRRLTKARWSKPRVVPLRKAL